MKQEQMVWELGICASKVWNLSLELSLQCAKLGRRGKGFAVIAFESEKVSEKLYSVLRESRLKSTDANISEIMEDLTAQLSLLAVNAMLELLKINHDDDSYEIDKALAVLVDRLHRLLDEMSGICGGKAPATPVPPIAKDPLKSIIASTYLYQFFIGGTRFCENADFLMECVLMENSRLSCAELRHRELTLPIIDLYARLGLRKPVSAYTSVLIVNTDWYKPDCLYAVPVDGISTAGFFRSPIGFHVPVNGGEAIQSAARECWDAEDGGQLIFPDWNRLWESAV